MGVNFVNKTISKNQISCNDTFQITLALTASPDIVNNPVDVFLVLDRSGSMAGEALENLQIGARTFVEIIAESTGGTSEIEGGSRIGIVSFSSTAVLDTPLTTSGCTELFHLQSYCWRLYKSCCRIYDRCEFL